MYTILDTVQNIEREVHISKLSPFIYDPSRTDPNEIARKDSEEFMVQQILDHRPHLKKGEKRLNSSQLEFLVRWASYPKLEDTWEPYKVMRNNTLLHQYLDANKMKSYIPTGVKQKVTKPKVNKAIRQVKPKPRTLRKRGRPRKQKESD
jgi:hypothetical protein